MSLSAGQLQTLAHLGDLYNNASTQKEKDYYHEIANTVRNNAGLKAGVDYNTVDGSPARAGVVSIPSARTTGNSNNYSYTPSTPSTVVNTPVYAYPAQPTYPAGVPAASYSPPPTQAYTVTPSSTPPVIGTAPNVPTPAQQASTDATTPLQMTTIGSSGLDKLVPIGALGLVLMIFMRLVK